MFEETMKWLMAEGSWQHSLWFAYVTFHDLIQWMIMTIIGLTAYGQRKHKKELQELVLELVEELTHVCEEFHSHMEEDAALHADLGQHMRVSRDEEGGGICGHP